METYWSIAEMDEKAADKMASLGMYREAAYFYQQAGEKYVKYILEQIAPYNARLKSHAVEKILAAYDSSLKDSTVYDQANYLTSFYFDTRYPGDNFDEIVEAQVRKARKNLTGIKEYCEGELAGMESCSEEEQ